MAEEGRLSKETKCANTKTMSLVIRSIIMDAQPLPLLYIIRVYIRFSTELLIAHWRLGLVPHTAQAIRSIEKPNTGRSRVDCIFW
jgi:hypothetical protein